MTPAKEKREIKSDPRDYPKLNNDEFKNMWDAWLDDRKERRKPVTRRAAEMQLTFLCTQPDPIACVRQSIERGWQGIFKIDTKPGDAQKNLGGAGQRTMTKRTDDYQGKDTPKGATRIPGRIAPTLEQMWEQQQRELEN